jgi:hypothetical protein
MSCFSCNIDFNGEYYNPNEIKLKNNNKFCIRCYNNNFCINCDKPSNILLLNKINSICNDCLDKLEEKIYLGINNDINIYFNNKIDRESIVNNLYDFIKKINKLKNLKKEKSFLYNNYNYLLQNKNSFIFKLLDTSNSLLIHYTGINYKVLFEYKKIILNKIISQLKLKNNKYVDFYLIILEYIITTIDDRPNNLSIIYY